MELTGVGRASNQCSPLDPFIQSTVFGIEYVRRLCNPLYRPMSCVEVILIWVRMCMYAGLNELSNVHMVTLPSLFLPLLFPLPFPLAQCTQLMSAIVNRSWTDIARSAPLSNWKEVLAALVTFAGPEDFATLCGMYTQKYVCTYIHTYVHTALLYTCTLMCTSVHTAHSRYVGIVLSRTG